MELQQAISLISDPFQSGSDKAIWADLGCGRGLFTYALANLLAAGSIIYAVDKNSPRLEEQPHPGTIKIKPLSLDFVNDTLPLQNLDGILMANSLHYVKDQPSLIQKLKRSMHENASFLIIEYDTETANQWVPYPVSFKSLVKLFHSAGYASVQKIKEIPSVYRKDNIYGAVVAK